MSKKRRKNPAAKFGPEALRQIAETSHSVLIAKAFVDGSAEFKVRVDPRMTPDLLLEALSCLSIEVWVKQTCIATRRLSSFPVAGIPFEGEIQKLVQ